MKAELVKQLHAVGVYRDPKTKQKLENMKMTKVLEVLNWVEEEMKNGVVFERKQWDYVFVSPQQKKEKVGKPRRSK